MPRSKRAKIISLTKVQSDGREGKQKLVRKVQKAVEKYAFVWVFKVKRPARTRDCCLTHIPTTRRDQVANVRTQALQDLRQEWSDSRL